MPPKRTVRRPTTKSKEVVLLPNRSALVKSAVDQLHISTTWRGGKQLLVDSAVFSLDAKGKRVDHASLGRHISRTRALVHTAMVVGDEAPTPRASSPVAGARRRGGGERRGGDDDGGGAGGGAGREGSAERVRTGDVLTVHLSKLEPLVEYLVVTLTVFNKETPLRAVRDLRLVVTDQHHATIATVPVSVAAAAEGGGEPHTCIAMTIYRNRSGDPATWAMMALGDAMAARSVRSVGAELDTMGLAELANRTRAAQRRTSVTQPPMPQHSEPDWEDDDLDDGDGDGSFDTESGGGEDDELAAAFAYPRPPSAPRPPRVVREGRKQYNVGNSVSTRAYRPQRRRSTDADDGDDDGAVVAVTSGPGADDDDEDDGAVRALFPDFDSNKVVRYEQRCYNVGSKMNDLEAHFEQQRLRYARIRGARPTSGGGPLHGAPSRQSTPSDEAPVPAGSGGPPQQHHTHQQPPLPAPPLPPEMAAMRLAQNERLRRSPSDEGAAPPPAPADLSVALESMTLNATRRTLKSGGGRRPPRADAKPPSRDGPGRRGVPALDKAALAAAAADPDLEKPADTTPGSGSAKRRTAHASKRVKNPQRDLQKWLAAMFMPALQGGLATTSSASFAPGSVVAPGARLPGLPASPRGLQRSPSATRAAAGTSAPLGANALLVGLMRNAGLPLL